MILPEPLLAGTFLRRYQRFLVDVLLPDGSTLTAHCPNSGSLRSCTAPGWPVRLSDSANPRRKLRFTWEMIHNGRCWIGINTHRANALAAEAITAGRIPELAGYGSLRREVRYGERSRVDLLLEEGGRRCWVEVKNVTLVDDAGRFAFPDAPTERGRRHLAELTARVAEGDRAVMLFVIQRDDGSVFVPAGDIDPAYARALRAAHAAGVEVLAWRAEVTPGRIEMAGPVPVELDEERKA